MRFWWVNQNQTYDQEVGGGYMWSPKCRADGARNPFYETMREVSPGDIVFSFRSARIAAIGLIKSYCYECPKPAEFGATGAYWNNVGWRVDVGFTPLGHQVRPRDHMDRIREHLPQKYSPLQEDGRGIQNLYLTNLSPALGAILVALIGREAQDLMRFLDVPTAAIARQPTAVEEWEKHLEEELEHNPEIPATERMALVRARRGQGIFKDRVLAVERRCRVTGVENQTHLIGSHIKPWRDSTNQERLDGDNGLLLTPNVDHLFDRGFISFEGSGKLLISPVADKAALQRMGIQTQSALEVGTFNKNQSRFLEFHRDSVFLRART